MTATASKQDFAGATGVHQGTGSLPGELTLIDLPAIYHGFCKELPAGAIQRTKGRETRKGYDTDGYGYQYCIDVLNNLTGKQMLALLEKINREYGSTVVIVTHNTAISAMAQRVIRMSSGRIVEILENKSLLPPERIEW
jgi:ABC-type enterochelin transport system ATPase subunit